MKRLILAMKHQLNATFNQDSEISYRNVHHRFLISGILRGFNFMKFYRNHSNILKCEQTFQAAIYHSNESNPSHQQDIVLNSRTETVVNR